MRFRLSRVIIVILLCLTITNLSCLAQSSENGFEDLQPEQWWYYPMIAPADGLLKCVFHTDGSPVEYFIIDEADYIENATVSEELLLYHETDASDDFEITVPRDGGWFWVFINHNPYTVRITYSWESTPPGFYISPYNLTIIGSIAGAIILLSIALYMKRK